MQAVELFGGADALASRIVSLLSEEDSLIRQLLGDKSPTEALRSISRQTLLDHLSDCGVSLDRVMQPSWNEETRNTWLQRMKESGTGSGIGADGSLAPESLLLETFVQLEALGEICSERSDSPPDVSRERIQELRLKYQTEFGISFS